MINTLDPMKATLIPEFYVIYGAFNALLKFNAKMEVVPDLAESFTVVDATTLEFKLRKGVKFQDGSDFTADDVKFTLERVADEKNAAPNRSKVYGDPGHPGRRSLHGPHRHQGAVRAARQLPHQHAHGDADRLPHRCQGDGRRSLSAASRWAPVPSSSRTGSRVRALSSKLSRRVLRRAQSRARVSVPFIAEESSGMTAILGNQIDLTSTAPFADVPSLEKRPEVKVLKQAGLNTRYIALNNKKGPFADIHFRRAVSMAFDREVLVKAVLFGEGVAIPGVLPPALWADPKPTFGEYVTFNPERARAEFAKSAFKPGTEATMLVWGSNWWRRMGEIVAGQANQILGTKITAAGDGLQRRLLARQSGRL